MKPYIWIIAGSALFSAAVLALVIYIFRQRREKHAAQELARQLSQQNKYWEGIVEQQRRTVDEIRIFRHDTRHHIAIAVGLIRGGDAEKAAEYLSEYRNCMKPISLLRHCENNTVNCVLLYFAAMAEDNGIEVKINTFVPASTGIDDIELGGLFSNLFENAVEGCRRLPESEKRYININCSCENGRLLISTENSCTNHIVFENDLPVSQKQNGGLGTISILHTAQKHRGLADFSVSDGVFYVKIILVGGTAVTR